jgi:hypothetical protein
MVGAARSFVFPAWLAFTVQVPELLVIVKVAPAFVQTPELLNETGRPELDTAATVKLPLYGAVLGALCVNVIVWVAGITVKVCDTEAAGVKSPLPDWLARTVTDPAPVIVRALPLTVAGPELTAKLKASPELAVAFNRIGPEPYTWFEIAGKPIVWLAWFTDSNTLPVDGA